MFPCMWYLLEIIILEVSVVKMIHVNAPFEAMSLSMLVILLMHNSAGTVAT